MHVVNSTRVVVFVIVLLALLKRVPMQRVRHATLDASPCPGDELPRWFVDVQRCINVPRTCHLVTMTVAVFPLQTSQGRRVSAKDLQLPRFVGPRECAVAVVSRHFDSIAVEARGWTALFVDAWRNVTSNELQRRVHLLKVLSLFLFPHADAVDYGDVKCHTYAGIFPSAAFSLLRNSTTCDIITVKNHGSFMRPLQLEFSNTLAHMRERNETREVFDDISRLETVFGTATLRRVVPMLDAMCLSQSRSLATIAFACRWARYVRAFSMREQLSFNVALLESNLSNCSCLGDCTAVDGAAFARQWVYLQPR